MYKPPIQLTVCRWRTSITRIHRNHCRWTRLRLKEK